MGSTTTSTHHRDESAAESFVVTGAAPRRRRGPLALGVSGAMVLLVAIPLGAATGTQDQQVAPPSAPEQPLEAFAGQAFEEGAIPATVQEVVDGDSINTHLGPVRLYGLDAPEAGPWADEARRAVAAEVHAGSTIWLWRPPGADDRDTHGRMIRMARAEGGSDIGQKLVAGGLAVAFTDFTDAYVPAEGQAREQGLRMWSRAPGRTS